MKKIIFALLISAGSLVICDFSAIGMFTDKEKVSSTELNDTIEVKNISLIKALTEKQLDIATKLISELNKQELTKTDRKSGRTALHIAASKGYEEIVKSLLDKNADLINLVDNENKTALHIAASKGHEEIVKSLLYKNPDLINLVDNENKTAIDYANQKNYTNVVNFLANSAKFLSSKNNFIEQIMGLMSEGHKLIQAQKIKEKIVMVLGQTGVGKGTLINYLNGIELTPEYISGSWKLGAKNTLHDISISHSTSKSDTFYPGIYSVDDNDLSYIDTPGFGDSRGVAHDIATAYFRQEVIKKAKYMKILLLMSYENFVSTNERGEKIKNQINNLSQFLQFSNNEKYITALKNAISLVVTQVEPPRSRVNELKNKLEEERVRYENSLSGIQDIQQKSNIIEDLLKKNIQEYDQGLKEVEATPAQRKNVIKSTFTEYIAKISKEEADIANVKQISIEYKKKDIDNQKDIANHLSLDSNFEIFSKPIEISADKAVIVPGEKEKILDLINKSEYINNERSNIKIGFPISPESKIVLTNLVQHVNKEIQTEIENSIHYIITTCKNIIDQSNNYRGLRKKLKIKQDNLIKITCSENKDEFLKNIEGKLSSEKKIKRNIEYLDFFNHINNDVETETEGRIYDLKSWVLPFYGIKDSISIIKQIEALLEEPKNEFKNDILKISGLLVSGEYVFNKVKIHGFVKELRIYAFNALFLDNDFQDLKLKGINFIVIAPIWKVIGEKVIDLTGKDGQDHVQLKASNGAPISSGEVRAGNPGENGLPGNPGGNGGNFLGIGSTFNNLSNLTINVSGGKGGKGQEGGNGSNGTKGSDGEALKVSNRDKEFLIIRKKLRLSDKEKNYKDKEILAIGEKLRLLDKKVLAIREKLGLLDKEKTYKDYSIHLIKELVTFNSRFLEAYFSEGKMGGKGGDAGRGGRGGRGGLSGNVKIIDTFPGNIQINEDWKVIKTQGINGEDGSVGKVGIGGKNGNTYAGVYVSEEILPGLRGRIEINKAFEDELEGRFQASCTEILKATLTSIPIFFAIKGLKYLLFVTPEPIPTVTPNQILDQVTDQVTDQIPNQVTDQIPAQVPEQIPAQVPEQIPVSLPPPPTPTPTATPSPDTDGFRPISWFSLIVDIVRAIHLPPHPRIPDLPPHPRIPDLPPHPRIPGLPPHPRIPGFIEAYENERIIEVEENNEITEIEGSIREEDNVDTTLEGPNTMFENFENNEEYNKITEIERSVIEKNNVDKILKDTNTTFVNNNETPSTLSSVLNNNVFQVIAFRAGISIISSYASSGWENEPSAIDMGKAEDGIQPKEKNEGEIKSPEEPVVLDQSIYTKDYNKYYNEYFEKARDFIRYISN